MSSTVLARKYRPRNFETLVGQTHVVQALANALTQQRLHHAYLFTGTRGVGKTTIARILAKSLNCTGPDGSGGITAQPCGVCAACRDIDAGRFIDYVELDAASNRGVDEITRLLDQAVYKPVVGRFKVYLIDEVHMLSTTAFNAMLKTLEEPPEYLKFILATTDPQKVPATVLSRCLQFNLRPMAAETIVDHLDAILATEDVAADAGALKLIARAARGSMRDAQSLTDQAIAYGSGAVEEAAVRQMLGAVDRSHAVRCVEARGGARRRGADRAPSTACASSASPPRARSRRWRRCCRRWRSCRRCPARSTTTIPTPRSRAGSPRCCPPTRRSCSTASSCAGRAEIALAPDEYSGLVMVLLRMLAFAPADARARRPRRRRRPRRARAPARERAAATSPRPRPRASPRRRAPLGARRVTDGAAVAAQRRSDDAAAAAPAGAAAGDAGADRGDLASDGAARRRPLGRDACGASSRRAPSPRWCASWRCRPSAFASSRARAAALAAARRAREPAHAGAAREAAGGGGRGDGRAGAARDRGRRGADTPAARDAAEARPPPGRGRAGDPRRSARQGAAGAVQDGAIVPGSVKPLGRHPDAPRPREFKEQTT